MNEPTRESTARTGVQEAETRVKKKSVLREYAEAILIAIILALLIRTFVVQAFKIPSGSMIPTLLVGDHILVNKFIYYFRDARREDVIVFKYPWDESRDFIKRVIAVGGEEVAMKDRTVFVNGRPEAKLNFTRETHSDQFGAGVVKFDRQIPLELAAAQADWA